MRKCLTLLTLLHPLATAAFSPTGQNPPLNSAAAATRRSFLANIPAAAGNAAAVLLPVGAAHAAAGGTPSVAEGMSAFAAGDVERSVQIYDAVIAADPRRIPYLWQRGLSLYYAGDYAAGAEQFAADVAVNPNDTEEQIWHLLCLSRTPSVGSLTAARPKKLAVGRDRRPVMRAAQALFLGEADEKVLMDLAAGGDAGSRFYARLYLSLYYEATGDTGRAEEWMVRSVGGPGSDYATSFGAKDPMVELARVAVQRRGWSGTAVK